MFTVDQLDFRFSGDHYVGCQEGSFVKEFLINHLHVNELRIKEYVFVEEYHEAMTKGSKNGGIDAIFDEIPYIKLFFERYDSEYKIVGSIYRTDGFAFALPLGSPLTIHFSRAILNVTESANMSTIEQRNFGRTYSSSGNQIDSISKQNPKLTSYVFGGLFIIIGSALVFALFCSETLIGRRLTDILAYYSQKTFFFLSFTRNDLRVRSIVHPEDGNGNPSSDEVEESEHIHADHSSERGTTQESKPGNFNSKARNGQPNESESGSSTSEIQLSELRNTDVLERQTSL